MMTLLMILNTITLIFWQKPNTLLYMCDGAVDSHVNDDDNHVDDGEFEGGRGGCEKAGSLQASSPCKTSPSCTNTVMTTVHKDPLLGL